MDIRTTFGLLIILLLGCNDNRQNSFAKSTSLDKLSIDTIVGSKTITNEIPGSAYRKRAIGYFVIIGKDTSDYTCIFTESKDNNNVGIDLNIKYLKASMTYRQRLKELKIIMPKAATDFNFDSLTGISFGRLILSGDLAIDVTKQYRQKYGASNKLQNYLTVQEFLKQSKLCADIDNLFKPYSISSDKVSIEKLFLTSRTELCWASKIEADTSNVPDKILDCMLGVKLKKR
ncbi:MAG: hypothetical protein WCK02_16485 [Bacteroidota bacterium]